MREKDQNMAIKSKEGHCPLWDPMGGRTTTMREDIRPGGALSEAKVL